MRYLNKTSLRPGSWLIHNGALKTNFATEILAEEALKTAEELDAYYQKTGQLRGQLHGIPVSVKVDLAYHALKIHQG